MLDLILAPSRIHGRGVFARCRIPRRMKLGEIGGVLRPLPAFRRRMAGRGVIHLIEVSRRWALDCTRDLPLGQLNHRCDANCYLRIHRRRVEVYSRGAIPAGHELTVDYGATPHRGGMACRCGSVGCRGTI